MSEREGVGELCNITFVQETRCETISSSNLQFTNRNKQPTGTESI